MTVRLTISSSGGSGGAGAGPKKTFLETGPHPPYIRVWMTAPPPPLSQSLDPALSRTLF